MNKREYTFDENIVSDLHKDAHGIRPGEYFWSNWDAQDNDGKQRIWDNLLDDLDRAVENEREAQAEAICDLEDRIQFMKNTVVGCTRDDAIRYLHDVYKTNGDVEYLEFHLGVPFSYLSCRKGGSPA